MSFFLLVAFSTCVYEFCSFTRVCVLFRFYRHLRDKLQSATSNSNRCTKTKLALIAGCRIKSFQLVVLQVIVTQVILTIFKNRIPQQTFDFKFSIAVQRLHFCLKL